MSIANHEVVEQALGIQLTNQYKVFLDTQGDYEHNGTEVYGYTSAYKDVEKIPCVIGATRLYRDSYNIAPEEIVISHTGYEDVLVILNNISGEVFEVSMSNRQKVADTFDEWLANLQDD